VLFHPLLLRLVKQPAPANFWILQGFSRHSLTSITDGYCAMPKPLDPASLPEAVASFAAARVAAGRYANLAEVLVAGVEALAAREQAEAEWLDYARDAVREGDADIAAGRYTDMSPDAFSSWLRAQPAEPTPR
jgi:Arc/MetJ-type ribon-helix-helix transcriptional regulator